MSLFTAADVEIKKSNSNPANTFLLGHNFMSTWTHDEYKKLLGKKGKPVSSPAPEQPEEITGPLVAEVDWRTKGVINKVKNQGQCGSCWAFAATCTIEAAHAISSGTLLSLSEQQVVDCDKTSDGCDGGLAQRAFKFLESTAQDLESEYRYHAKDGTCDRSKTGHVKVKTYKDVTKHSGDHLKAAIMETPVAVSVEADKNAFQRYKSGILNSRLCGENTDHAITAVGYGTEGDKEYYIVRNSWGASWGEEGYIRIAVEKTGKGICGIQTDSCWPSTD